MIDNMTSQILYIEKYIPMKINVSSVFVKECLSLRDEDLESTDIENSDSIISKIENENGILGVDESGNIIFNTSLDIGTTSISGVENYNLGDYLLLYNSYGEWCLVDNDTKIDIRIDFKNKTQYKIRANEYLIVENNKNTFPINLTGKDVFKVFLNDTEIEEYSYTDNGIEVLGNSTFKVDSSYNTMVVIAYDKNQLVEQNFKINYLGVETISDIDLFMNEDKMSSRKNVMKLSLYTTLSYSESKTFSTYEWKFGRKKQITTDKSASLSISTYTSDDEFNIGSISPNEVFRVIVVNPTFGKVVLYNNCVIEDGKSENYEKGGNTINSNINCDNRIELIKEML